VDVREAEAVSRGKIIHGKNKGESETVVRTQPELLAAVEARWGSLTWDLAALPENAVADKYITPWEDSLAPHTEWPLDELPWLNPPYDDITPWVRKCDGYHRAYGPRFEALLLIPAAIGSRWYADHCFNKCETIPLMGRPQFLGYGNGAATDHMILHYGGSDNQLTMLEPWDWMSAWARI